ncbi:DUF5999 family protein [Streptomyces sp. NBC_00322]|uniref:DUF5999 family protein n=1 Tax=Streptomyces sp. NBC_00322 TaxID=2975712 RepID=UPI002E2A283F|nr:DUF5999 family protein [Streptomyces sp. NBC_00322]
MCEHEPPCPPWEAPDHEAARVVASHPEQGWVLLCNSVVIFEDTGEILPDLRVVTPHRSLPILPASRMEGRTTRAAEFTGSSE